MIAPFPIRWGAYAELNGDAVERDGTMTDEGWVTVVVVRLQFRLDGVPDAKERLVVCNGTGEY